MITKIFTLFLAILMGITLLTGCSKGKTDPFKKFSAQQLYEKGEFNLANREYQTAISFFEALDARYPFSIYAEQAQLDIIYAYYKSGDKASAVAAAERYIQVYPASPNVDYAYYLKGIANFDQEHGFLQRYVAIDDAQRDLGTAFESYQDFSTLIHQFPDSKYAPDARKRMIHLRELLAKHEYEVAEYYYERGSYVAAINRAQGVIHNFPQTTTTESALVLLVKANRKIGLQSAANDALRILKLNYPESEHLHELGAQSVQKKEKTEKKEAEKTAETPKNDQKQTSNTDSTQPQKPKKWTMLYNKLFSKKGSGSSWLSTKLFSAS